MSKEEQKRPKHAHAHRGPHKKIFDITPPGKTSASPNSRPVLADHQPPVADDQFVPSAPTLRASNPFDKHSLLDGRNKKQLTPVSQEVKEHVGTSASEDEPEVPTAPTAPTLSKANTPDVPSLTVDKNASVADHMEAAAKARNDNEDEDEPVISAVPHASTPSVDMRKTEEETAAHLLMEQMVQADDGIESHQLREPGAPRPAASQNDLGVPNAEHAKTIEQLMAESGAPLLGPDTTPGLIVSHHQRRKSTLEPILIFFAVIFVAFIALDLLLDAEIIRTGLQIPYTNFID